MGNENLPISSQRPKTYQCPTHPQNNITKICLAENCNQPLCEQCVNSHHAFHTSKKNFARIRPFQLVHQKYRPRVPVNNVAIVQSPPSKIVNPIEKEPSQRRSAAQQGGKPPLLKQSGGLPVQPVGAQPHIPQVPAQQPISRVQSQPSFDHHRLRRPKQQEIAEYLLPSSLMIKNLTRQYFDNRQRDRNSHVSKLINNQQLWRKVQQDPEVNQRIIEFLRTNTRPNKEIIGRDYTHLY